MTPEQFRSLADVVHCEAFAECSLAETVEAALREAAAQLTAAHTLIAQWREEAERSDEVAVRMDREGRPADARAGAIRASIYRDCADQLEALLTPQEKKNDEDLTRVDGHS